MRQSIIDDESGLTIIEVLMSAVVFMTGFSLLIALLNGTLVKLTTQDIDTAAAIGQQYVRMISLDNDTLDLDTIVVLSKRKYEVNRQVGSDGPLKKIRVTVTRVTDNRKLIDLYNEFVVPEKP